MSDLERANIRLETAIDRLSAAMAAGKAGHSDALAELGKLKAAHAKLKDVAGRVVKRLDGAIGRIGSVLGETGR